MTTEEFIQKAKAIHGDKYDYSKVEYVNSKTKVCIVCPEHGEFWQIPYNHLKGAGCHVCSRIKCGEKRSKKISQKEALKRIENILKGSPYQVLHPLKYHSEWNTTVKLCCSIHNTIWEIGWHSLIEHEGMNKKFMGCPECRQVYTKEDCAKAARLYTSRSEFESNRPGEYTKALKRGWLDEICTHMPMIGNWYYRCIYSYVFEVEKKKFVYVGLTSNLNRRNKEHRNEKESAVYKFAKKFKVEIPTMQQLTDYLPKENIELCKAVESEFIPMLKDKSKFHIIDPQELLAPLEGNEKYSKLLEYLRKRYW